MGTTDCMCSVGGYGLTAQCGRHDDPVGSDVADHAARQNVAQVQPTGRNCADRRARSRQ